VATDWAAKFPLPKVGPAVCPRPRQAGDLRDKAVTG